MESCKRGIFVCTVLIEIETGCTESLKGISLELHSVKNEFRYSSGKMLVSLEKRKLIKSEFIREISEFDCSENGKSI